MKHLNDTTIQNYIDNELPENERKNVEMHLDECPSCRQKAESRRAFSDKVKSSLETLAPDEVKVPDFRFGNTASPQVNVTRIAIISSLSTACAIALIMLVVNLMSKPKPSNRIIDYYTIEDYDANKPYAEQEFAEFKLRTQTEIANMNL